jgi:cation transporter-like permease
MRSVRAEVIDVFESIVLLVATLAVLAAYFWLMSIAMSGLDPDSATHT